LKINLIRHKSQRNFLKPHAEPPTTRRTSGLDFSARGGKRQRHGSALIGAGETGSKTPALKTPNQDAIGFLKAYIIW